MSKPDELTLRLQKFFGANPGVMSTGPYELRLINGSGDELIITAEAGTGYKQGEAWLEFEIVRKGEG